MKWPKEISLVSFPNKVLTTKCQPLQESIPQHISEQMFEIMKTNNGVGLAAPQVGLPYRFFVMKTGNVCALLCNPTINRVSSETVILEEGCLSIPGIALPVRRPTKIWVNWIDGSVKELQGIEARVFLHEYDHLDGILFPRRFAELFES